MSADLIIKIAVVPVITNQVTNSAAAIDIPQDGTIESILMWASPTSMDALNDVFRTELSFGGTNSFDLNDARISICELNLNQNFLTTGGGVGIGSLFLGALDIPVAGGERIHLHTSMSAGPLGSAGAYLYFDARGVGARRRTQRRR